MGNSLFTLGLLALFVGLLLWLKRWIFGAPAATYGHIDGPGLFACDVVGESFYQEALETVAGGRLTHSAKIRKVAVLVPEPDNPHDANAVRVDIDGRTVGYLNRDDAKAYSARLRKHGSAGLTYSFDSLIVGGWDRGGGDRGRFGVKLDMPSK